MYYKSKGRKSGELVTNLVTHLHLLLVRDVEHEEREVQRAAVDEAAL